MSEGRRQPDEIFNDALELPHGERSAFLDAACGGDDALRREIEDLLSHATDSPAGAWDDPIAPLPEVIGRYRILDELGRGGMGVVYRAVDPDLGREVALKRIPREQVPDRASARFEREARILASFSDPHIATIHSFEESEGVRFVTMELVEGETLESMVARGPLRPDRAAEIVGQIARALEAAHDQNVVHRDIKPGNVVVRPDGLVKVLDFGIARIVRDPDSVGSGAVAGPAALSGIQGTPAYISPEVAAGGEATSRSDLWATGCVLHECLTGRRPFSTMLTRPDRAPGLEFPRGVPRSLRSIVAACLQPDPERRLSSAAELRSRLDAYLGRRRRRAIGAVVVLAVAVVAAVGAARLLHRAPPLSTVEIVQREILRGIDRHGDVLWQRKMDGAVRPNQHGLSRAVSPFPVMEVRGERRVYVSTFATDSRPATMICLDAATGETIWNQPIDWVSSRSGQGPLHCRWMFEWRGGAWGPALTLGLRDGMWYGMAVRTIRADGTEIGTYYHPGSLAYEGQVDLEDGRRALLLYGGNSSARLRRDIVPYETDQHPGVVALVVPGEGAVQAFPYGEDLAMPPSAGLRDWPGMPKAREEAYLIVPPLGPTVETRVGSVDPTEGARPDLAYHVRLSDGRLLALDARLRPLSCFLMAASPAESTRAAGGVLPDLFHFRHGEMERVSVPFGN